MGRRYYCDFCDKRFIDDLEGRKKHLASAHHIKMKKLHYDMFVDAKTIFEQETQKFPCKRFLQNGDCQFKGNCKYSHYSNGQLMELKEQIEQEAFSKIEEKNNSPTLPNIDVWLQNYYAKNSKELEADNDYVNTSWTYPKQLSLRNDLPPSLRKFQPEHFHDSEFDEWG